MKKPRQRHHQPDLVLSAALSGLSHTRQQLLALQLRVNDLIDQLDASLEEVMRADLMQGGSLGWRESGSRSRNAATPSRSRIKRASGKPKPRP